MVWRSRASSNTVSNAIPGVTFQLLGSAPGTQIQVEITNNNTDIETAVGKFVSAYNAVINDINGQEKNDSTGQAEPLFGSPTLALIQSQISGALFSGAASGAIKNITQLGIELNNDGTLTLERGHPGFRAQLQLCGRDRIFAELGQLWADAGEIAE